MISFAFKTREKAYLVTQTTLSDNIMRIKESKDEVTKIDGILVHLSGHQRDSYRLGLFLKECENFFKTVYGKKVNHEIIKKECVDRIYNAVRSNLPKEVGATILSVENEEFKLCSVDNYGATNENGFITTNYGVYFLYGLADTFYSENLTHDESVDFINLCIKALKEKMILDSSHWRLDLLDKNGEHSVQYLK